MNKSFKSLTIIIVLILLTSLVIILLLVNVAELTLAEMSDYIFHKNFQPEPNIILPAVVANRPLNTYFYLIIIITFVIVFFLRTFVPSLREKPSPLILIMISFLVYTLSLCIQTIYYTNFYLDEHKVLVGKSLPQRQESLFGGQVFRFAQQTKRYLTTPCSAEFMTDMDVGKDPGMILKNILAFHLYPIDIRDIRKKPHDCMIIYYKKDALKFVPNDFHVIKTFDDKSLIAVKKNTAQ